jgi:hypothetical protein
MNLKIKFSLEPGFYGPVFCGGSLVLVTGVRAHCHNHIFCNCNCLEEFSFFMHSLHFAYTRFLLPSLDPHRYFGGRVSVALTTAAFFLAIPLLLQHEKPRFSQLSSAIFGLFYCGYLPCFWIKLRCGTAIPALTSSK